MLSSFLLIFREHLLYIGLICLDFYLEDQKFIVIVYHIEKVPFHHFYILVSVII
jgi:hypothetical protein